MGNHAMPHITDTTHGYLISWQIISDNYYALHEMHISIRDIPCHSEGLTLSDTWTAEEIFSL